jgi:hypothetical protein
MRASPAPPQSTLLTSLSRGVTAAPEAARGRRPVAAPWLALTLFSSGCDPTFNLWGSMFPAWVSCLLVAVVLAVLARIGLARAGLETHLGPLVVVYPSLLVLLACLSWLFLFRG